MSHTNLSAAEIALLNSQLPNIGGAIRSKPVTSDGDGWRVGTSTKISKSGRWFDFKARQGGFGAVSFIAHFRTCTPEEAVAWAQSWLAQHPQRGPCGGADEDDGAGEDNADTLQRRAYIESTYAARLPIAGRCSSRRRLCVYIRRRCWPRCSMQANPRGKRRTEVAQFPRTGCGTNWPAFCRGRRIPKRHWHSNAPANGGRAPQALSRDTRKSMCAKPGSGISTASRRARTAKGSPLPRVRPTPLLTRTAIVASKRMRRTKTGLKTPHREKVAPDLDRRGGGPERGRRHEPSRRPPPC